MTMNSHMTPREIVSELDRYIVGQRNAKRAVAIALRNRWRRQQVPEPLAGTLTGQQEQHYWFGGGRQCWFFCQLFGWRHGR